MTAELTLRQPVDAPAQTVWTVALDWERQHEWMRRSLRALARRCRDATPG